MFLPENVLTCIRTLETAGFEAYAVGGCVRDALLGLSPHDYDLCTAATPQQTAALFAGHTLVRSGEKHGTIGVVMHGEVIEITTFRTEGGYQDSRHPDWVHFVSHVQEDLARRDFTVNAMAYSPTRGYIDPFGGQADLKNKVLRAVGVPRERFSEDALRILRGVRFSVRFGLKPRADTLLAMRQLAPSMDKLARERVFDELCKLLQLISAEDLVLYADILTAVLPPLAPCVGFLQHNPHHTYDVFTHTAKVTEAVPASLSLRWAALLHDCGKPLCFTRDEKGIGHFYGHAKIGAELADKLLLQLKAPTALRERVVFLIAQHMTTIEPDRKFLRRALGKYGREALFELLALQAADGWREGAEVLQVLEEVLAEEACLQIRDLKIGGADLLTLGFAPGPALGRCLQSLLEQVQDETLENKREALLAAALLYK